MHPPERVATALELSGSRLTATEIARRLGVPRSTVKDWIAGRVPRGGRGAESRCETCGMGRHEPELLGPEYVYLLGMYLGDGCISSHPRGVYKLRVTLDLRYPGIVEECRQAMRSVRPQSRAARLDRTAPDADHPTYTEIYAYSKSWPCLFPQHGPGMKHLRPIQLVDWQLELVEAHPGKLLRGLIHSDGCRFINTGTNWRHPRYVFHNASADIRGIFRRGCELLELRYTEAPRTVYVSRTADVARLDELIGPKA